MKAFFLLVTILIVPQSAQADSCRKVCYLSNGDPCGISKIERTRIYHAESPWYQCDPSDGSRYKPMTSYDVEVQVLESEVAKRAIEFWAQDRRLEVTMANNTQTAAEALVAELRAELLRQRTEIEVLKSQLGRSQAEAKKQEARADEEKDRADSAELILLDVDTEEGQ